MSTYLDFYLTLDVSGSMGLPSTSGPIALTRCRRSTRTILCNIQPAVPWPAILRRKQRLHRRSNVTPPNNYPSNPPTTTTSYTQRYSTSSYCMGYCIRALVKPR